MAREAARWWQQAARWWGTYWVVEVRKAVADSVVAAREEVRVAVD